jgi:hypothetical protein
MYENSYTAHVIGLSEKQIGNISLTLASTRAVVFADLLGFAAFD